MRRPYFSRGSHAGPPVRVNGRIRAREVRLVGSDGQQKGVVTIQEAMTMARTEGLDLVEVAASANPPVCRLVDYGKFRYEQAKKEKDQKKHQHANKVKEVQLSPNIDPHDAEVKRTHAIDFLCEDMKVKVTLRFRGRENAHQEYGYQVVENFIKEVAPYGHPDAPIRKIGRGINVMISPHPRSKRAKNPRPTAAATSDSSATAGGGEPRKDDENGERSERVPINAAEQPSGFGQNPFEKL